MARLPRTLESVTEVLDIPYKNDNELYHKLDIYTPKNAKGKLPLIIDIHGGGWIYGTKEINKYYCLSLAGQGFAVANLNYHLFQDYAYPEPVQDIFTAFNFLLVNGEKYNLDLNNIF